MLSDDPRQLDPAHRKRLKRGLKKYRNMVRSKQKARKGLGKYRYR